MDLGMRTPDFSLRTNPYKPQGLQLTPRNRAYRLSPRVGSFGDRYPVDDDRSPETTRSSRDQKSPGASGRGAGASAGSRPSIQIPCVPVVPRATSSSPVSVPRIPLHLLNGEGTGSGQGDLRGAPSLPPAASASGEGVQSYPAADGLESPRRRNLQQSAREKSLEPDGSVTVGLRLVQHRVACEKASTISHLSTTAHISAIETPCAIEYVSIPFGCAFLARSRAKRTSEERRGWQAAHRAEAEKRFRQQQQAFKQRQRQLQKQVLPHSSPLPPPIRHNAGLLQRFECSLGALGPLPHSQPDIPHPLTDRSDAHCTCG